MGAGVDTEAKWALSQLANSSAMRHNCPKSTATASLYGRLSVALSGPM